MFLKDLRFQLLTILIYVAAITLLGRHFQLPFFLFWLGAITGTLILYFDLAVSAYLASAESALFQKVKQLVKERKIKELILTSLACHLQHEEPILHSALFQTALTILAFYVITSSNSFFGAGLLVGMVLHLIKDEMGKRQNLQELKKMLFWNIHRQISDREQKIYLGVVFALFGVETILLL